MRWYNKKTLSLRIRRHLITMNFTVHLWGIDIDSNSNPHLNEIYLTSDFVGQCTNSNNFGVYHKTDVIHSYNMKDSVILLWFKPKMMWSDDIYKRKRCIFFPFALQFLHVCFYIFVDCLLAKDSFLNSCWTYLEKMRWMSLPFWMIRELQEFSIVDRRWRTRICYLQIGTGMIMMISLIFIQIMASHGSWSVCH